MHGRAHPDPTDSEIQGHYYANKAPGTILLGTVAYFSLYHAENLFGLDPAGVAFEANLYLVNLFVSVFFVALSICAFRRLLIFLGTTDQRAAVLSLVLAFGTLLFPYDNQMWGHTTAAAFSLLGLFGLVQGTRRGLFFAGLFAGMAVLTDYLAAVVVASYGVYALWVKAPGRGALGDAERRALWYCLGGLGPLIIFMAYHYACFGAPFSSAMKYTAKGFIDEDRLLGLFGIPEWRYVGALLVSRSRGLLLHAPVLLFSLIGLAFWLKEKKTDPLARLTLACMTLFLLINASFNGWQGGATVCARYQMLAMPFWVLAMKEIPWKTNWKRIFVAVAAFSAFNMLAVASVSPIMPEWEADSAKEAPSYLNPLWLPDDPDSTLQPEQGWPDSLLYDSVYGWTYERFGKGDMGSATLRRFYNLRMNGRRHWHLTNLGLLLGLPGKWSLLPLLFLTGAGGFLLLRSKTS